MAERVVLLSRRRPAGLHHVCMGNPYLKSCLNFKCRWLVNQCHQRQQRVQGFGDVILLILDQFHMSL